MLTFRLNEEFVSRYAKMPEKFGFGALGAVTFYRTYSRLRQDGTQESWTDVCRRVVEGMYSIQLDYAREHGVPIDLAKMQSSAMEAFDRMYNLKWSPPGRGLSHMGLPSIHERGMYEALQNCGFITTKHIKTHRGKIFSWIMEMLMLGVGIGSDLDGANSIDVVAPTSDNGSRVYVIPDSREGWAKSLELLFDSYTPENGVRKESVYFDYSEIRPAGEPIRGFGGVASGPEPLRWMHERVRESLQKCDGKKLSTRALADIINLIGVVVVAGNVRRSSEILLGDAGDTEFRELKDYGKNPSRADIGWSSNNSVRATVGMDYRPFVGAIMENGEPGFFWRENANNYGRMNGVIDTRDQGDGVNPCGEQILYGHSSAGVGGELCTLCEIYLPHHTDKYDFLRTIKFAYLYGKTITLLSEKIRHPGTRDIMTRNRRIGLSLTGITQAIGIHGLHDVLNWMDTGYNYVQHYDLRYSEWLKIPRSIRTTSVKPSGSVSLVAGVTPGIHFPHSVNYIRRIRLSDTSNLVDRLIAAGIPVEPAVTSRNTVVAEFPVFAGENLRSAKEVPLWEQLKLASLVQRMWSDNSVSVTVSINPETTTERDVLDALRYFQYDLKAVSMLPETSGGAYEQMPYEEITHDEYLRRASLIDFSALQGLSTNGISRVDKMVDQYCDGEACSIAPVVAQ